MKSHDVQIGLALCALVVSLPVSGANQRSFVASNGNDANPCSLTLPCRSFAAAITQANSGGEVIVLDSAGYGPVTITQSVSIMAPPGVYAGISVPAGQGVAINAAGGIVVLRGLTINGLGGTDGVFVQSAAKVHVDNCIITGFSNDGIKVNGPAEVSIIDSATRENSAAGIEIVGANATIERVHSVGGFQGIIVSGSANVTIHKSVISSNNVGIWIKLYSPAPAATAHVAISESVVDRNSGNGILAENGVSGSVLDVSAVRNTITRNGYGIYVHAMVAPADGATLTATDNDVNQNTITGLVAGPYGTLIASRNTVTRNTTGMSADFVGHLLTRGDNTVEKNATDVSGTGTPENIDGK